MFGLKWKYIIFCGGCRGMEFDILNIIFLLIEPESVMNIKSSLTPLKMQWVFSRFPGGQTQCLSEVDSAFE